VGTKLTLEDIGRLAGVSRSTVSRVINHQSVSPDARRRVEDAIRRTGFSPNVAARSLASRRTGVIGIVVPSRVHALFEDPYFGRLIRGMSRASNEAGTTLSLFLFETEEEEAGLYPRVVGAGLVDGVIVTASRMGDPLVERLVDGDLPFVMVGRPDRDEAISYVDADNVGGARHAAAHLCHLGYRRIGYLGAPLNTTAGVDRLQGFLEGLAVCGASFDPTLRADGDFSESSGYHAMARLIPQRPDAVFVASDTMAVGALRALREAELRVPDDVAVVSFDGLPPSERTLPPLTTVRQPTVDAGERAVRLLLDLIGGTALGPRAEILPTELVVRDSCGAAPLAEHRRAT
jgi:LacI family transcriptional regulator